MASSQPKNTRVRSSVTGQFVPRRMAITSPKITETEVIRKKTK